MLYGSLDNDFLRLGLAFLTALAVSLAVGAWLIRLFFKKNVMEDTTQPDHPGLNEVQSKKKAATMGGLMILAGILASVFLWSNLSDAQVWLGLLVLVVLGAAGFADDYLKLKHKPKRGLSKTKKLVIQLALGGIVGYLFIATGSPHAPATRILIPFTCDRWADIGWWFIPWCGLVMAATSNAVNLTDGLDGLAGGLTVITALALLLIGPILRSGHEASSFFCLSMAGAVLGFLRYNCNPAQIFMGDTGSLALGGLLAYIALAAHCEFYLLIAGAVFFIEELTVAMQIASFKLTKKRIFPITPIHHHFQVNLKWPEQKIVARAWILGIVFAAVAIGVAVR